MSEKVFILIFHGVGNDPRPGEEKVWVSLDSLRSALDVVSERSDVRVTFDDSNASDYDLALPELLARDLTATFFVVAGRIDQPGYLTRTAIRELVDAGMSVQSHGMRHPCWRGLDRASLREELVTARDRIQEVTARTVDEVAIPFCLYDRRVLAALRAADYRHVFTCDRGPANPHAWLQPRNQVSNGENGRKVLEITAPSARLRMEIAMKAPIKRWR